MRRGRRRRKVGKHISLSATDADWETVRSNANRRGLSIARYLVELVERDASEEDAGLRHECPELTLAAEEQRELLEAVREVNGGGIMLHARRPGGPVAAAQNCATHGPLSVATRGRRCTAWSSMRRFDWRLSTRV